jgi:pentatricopeptide repeat protein
MEVYTQFTRLFRPGALAALGLTSATRYPVLEKLGPDHYTIAIMMHAFCREDRGLRVAWRMYREYQRVLREITNPYRAVLVKAGSFIPNSFMMALGAHQAGLHYAARVMEEMLQERSPIKPGVVSWSILLQILVKRGDMAEAERVIDLMRSKGVQPNAVTWTTLLNGYMTRHNLHKTGQIIARMSQMYLQPDRATIDKLTAYLNSQELLGGIRSIEKPEETQQEG